MSTANVPNRVGNPFPHKKKTMKLFYHLLSDMKHQRVAVIALALGQAVNIPNFFVIVFTNCILCLPPERQYIEIYLSIFRPKKIKRI